MNWKLVTPLVLVALLGPGACKDAADGKGAESAHEARAPGPIIEVNGEGQAALMSLSMMAVLIQDQRLKREYRVALDAYVMKVRRDLVLLNNADAQRPENMKLIAETVSKRFQGRRVGELLNELEADPSTGFAEALAAGEQLHQGQEVLLSLQRRAQNRAQYRREVERLTERWQEAKPGEPVPPPDEHTPTAKPVIEGDSAALNELRAEANRLHTIVVEVDRLDAQRQSLRRALAKAR